MDMTYKMKNNHFSAMSVIDALNCLLNYNKDDGERWLPGGQYLAVQEKPVVSPIFHDYLTYSRSNPVFRCYLYFPRGEDKESCNRWLIRILRDRACTWGCFDKTDKHQWAVLRMDPDTYEFQYVSLQDYPYGLLRPAGYEVADELTISLWRGTFPTHFHILNSQETRSTGCDICNANRPVSMQASYEVNIGVYLDTIR